MKKLIVLLFISTGLFGQETQNYSQQIDSIFREYNSKGPGCAIAVVKDGKLIYSKGYGLANLDYDIPNTPTTVFDIASVSKQFAAYGIATLLEEKKLSLQDDIRKYIPEVPDFGKIITIDHLVHHTSGLRDWTETLAVAGWRGEEVYSMEDIMRMLKRQKGLDFPPGSKYQYSNTGYNLLAILIERITGKSFLNWTKENIYSPLGMGATQFLGDHRRIIKNQAYSYYPADDQFMKANSQLTALGSSSMFTTVNDFSKWMISVINGIREQKPVYTRMLQTGTLETGEKITYAFGLVVEPYKGVRRVSHTGSWAGYRSVANYYPDQNFGVVILANTATFTPSMADQIAALFIGTHLKAPPGAVSTGIVSTDPTVNVDSNILRKHTGIYKLGPGWLVNITLENGSLMTRATDEDKFPLEAKNASGFWVPAYGASMTFNKDKQGKTYQVTYKAIQAKKVQPFTVDVKSFQEFAGEYYSEELSTVYKLYVKQGKLMMEHMRNGEHEVRAIGKDEFFSNGAGELEFQRNAKKVTGFKLSAGRIKNLSFVKW